MPEVKQISAAFSRSGQKKRVAAYCRVSTSSADQQNSYANQVRTYTRMITQRPDWELVDIFADEGLSGMKASNRNEFQRMIRMCELRQIDLIITKSVSRFGRNVMDSLSYARKLKLLGIGIQFEENGINTLALGDEMLLSTFAAIAQEESPQNLETAYGALKRYPTFSQMNVTLEIVCSKRRFGKPRFHSNSAKIAGKKICFMRVILIPLF